MSKKRKQNSHGDAMAMLAAVVEVFKELPTRYDEAYELVGQTDLESQDLLHEVELLTLTRKDASEVLAAIRDNRSIRREAKDFMQVAKPLYDFVKRHRSLLTELAHVQTEMNRQNKAVNDRIYLPRVRHEKTEQFIQLTAKETGKSPEAIREGLRKSGYAGYEEAAASAGE